MNKQDVENLKCGLYRIYWKHHGGSSLAAVGCLADGHKWLAPTNWVAPTTDWTWWHRVEKAELILANEGDC